MDKIAEALAKELEKHVGCPHVVYPGWSGCTFINGDCKFLSKTVVYPGWSGCICKNGDYDYWSKAVGCWIKWAKEADNATV